MPNFPDRLVEIATELEADLSDIGSLEEAQEFLHEMVTERRNEAMEDHDALDTEIDCFESDDVVEQHHATP